MTEQEIDAAQAGLKFMLDCYANKQAWDGYPRKIRDGIDAITTLRAQLAEARAINGELQASVAIAEDYAHRAEAERAAQIEADANVCDLVFGSSLEHSAGMCADAIRAQPHSRTALDAAISAAKVAGLGAAADVIWHGPIWEYGGKADGVSLMAAHACRDAILTLIDKERA